MEATSTPKRPLSAIFLGNSGLSVETQSGAEGSGLPSPPATNSTASTGKESLPKRVRKTSIAFATVKSMLTGERRQHARDIQREELVEDEDHTARLSGPTASTSSDGSQILGRSSIGARSTSSGGLDRVRSLADRNRMVLDKLSSISSAASSRLGSPAPTDRVPLTASTLRSRNVSPMPPLSASTLFPPKSNASTGSSPRGAYATLPSPNGRARDEPDSRISPSDSGASSGKGPDHSFSRGSIVGRRASARDSPRVREVEFVVDHDESTTPKERERLYEQQRAPPVFSVSGDGNSSGVRREGSVRVSFSRTRPEMDVDEFGMSGTHARQRVYSTESDDRSITPPADASRRYTIDSPAARPRRVSINEPDTSPTKAREPLRTRAAAGTIGRQRNSSEIIERTVAAARKSPVRSRGALPSEFRSSTESKRASFDNKRFSLDGKRTFSRSSNSPELPRRDSGLGNRASPVTSGTRAATVRESSRRTHSRWASEDVSGDTEPSDRPRPRYERRGGSIESPITPGGRSVVGESFRAAGLTKRRDPEPPAPANRAGTRESIDWEIEELRNGISRVGVGDGRIHEEDDDDDDDDDGRERSVTPDNKRVQARNIQNIVTSRPGTSSGDYEEGPRTAPPALRPYRSMNTGLMTPSGSGTVRGATPVTPAMLVSASSTEHVRLMLESFAMFESNLARADGATSGGGSSAVSELLQNTDVVVQASQRLNTLLRESAARALTEQIESEVEDRDVREMEVWKQAGAEFRDALKVCDELVRSMTGLLLGVGRVVKERGDEDHTRSSGRVSSSEIRSGRMSAEGIRTGRMSAEGIRSGRMSAEGLRSGRMSAEGLRPRVGDTGRLIEEGRRNAEVRRSLDGGPGDALSKLTSRETTRWHDPMRPSTSMSLLRERGRVSPIDSNPIRQSTSRRFFPQSSSDADTSFGTDSYQTPSPAARVMPNGEHHRERMLSIPPSLETVPSESIVRKAEKTPTITRRPRMSVGTVRGAAPFPTSAPAPAPTQLSTATAIGNGSPEKGRSISYTVSRSGGAATVSAMTGLQAQARKRTISAADPLDEISSPTEMSDGATQRLQSTITRSRASVDFSADEGSMSGSERRPRRRTATELFT